MTRLLLLPESTIESPKTTNAGIVSLPGSFTRPSVLHKIIMKTETNSGIVEENEAEEEEEEAKSIMLHIPWVWKLVQVII